MGILGFVEFVFDFPLKKSFLHNRPVMEYLLGIFGPTRVWARHNTAHNFNSEVEWPPASPDLSCWSVGLWSFELGCNRHCCKRRGRGLFQRRGQKDKWTVDREFMFLVVPSIKSFLSPTLLAT